MTVRGWRSLGWDADGRLARAIMSTCDEFSKKKNVDMRREDDVDLVVDIHFCEPLLLGSQR